MKLKFVALAIVVAPCFAFAQGPAETDAQKLAKSISTLQRMIELIRMQKTASAPFRPQAARKMFWAFGNDQAPAPLPADVEARAQRMQAMTQVGTCELIMPAEQDYHVGQDQMQAGVTGLHAELGGKDCPVAMSVTLKAQQVGDRIDAQFDLSFRALTPEFQVEADLIEAHQSGLVQMELTTPAGGQRLVMKAEIAGGGTSKSLGAFDSKQVFDVDFNFVMPMSLKLKMNTEHSFSLNSNNLTLKTETSMDGIFSSTEKYYFNGQDITKDVYETLAQGIRFVGIDEKKSDKVLPLSCRLRVLDKNKTLLHEVSACQKDVAQEWNYQGKLYTSSIAFKKDWAESTFGPSGSSGETFYSQYEEEGIFERVVGDFVLQSECKPATCP